MKKSDHPHDLPGGATDSRADIALAVSNAIRDMTAGAGTRAYDSGLLLGRMRAERLYVELGHSAFEAFLDAIGLKRSTAFSNMLLAKIFERSDMAFGVSKLRALLQVKIADPRALLSEGVPVAGGPNRSIEAYTYRELVEWVKAQPGAPLAAAEPTPIASATMAAAAALIGTGAPLQAAS